VQCGYLRGNSVGPCFGMIGPFGIPLLDETLHAAAGLVETNGGMFGQAAALRQGRARRPTRLRFRHRRAVRRPSRRCQRHVDRCGPVDDDIRARASIAPSTSGR